LHLTTQTIISVVVSIGLELSLLLEAGELGDDGVLQQAPRDQYVWRGTALFVAHAVLDELCTPERGALEHRSAAL
jgi:hypothetical protein